MGKHARLREERRRARAIQGRPTDLLRELFDQIRNLTQESPRRVWELLLEIIGHATGVNCLNGGCLTPSSEKVIGDLTNLESLLNEYVESWDAELQGCRLGGSPVTDPLGTLLEESGGTNEARGQFFTPLSVVRLANGLTMGDLKVTREKRPSALDQACGTGRFALDALVHHPTIVTFNVDIDLAMVRASIINFRLASRFSHAIITPPSSPNSLFTEDAAKELRARGLAAQGSEEEGRLIVIGARSWIICADSLIVDLQCDDNWRYSWLWDPPPWRETMKVTGFDGTFDEWRRSRPRREVEEKLERREAPRRESLIELKLDEDRLHAHLVRAMNEVDLLMPNVDDDARSALHGPPLSVRGMSVLAGHESGVPRLRRGPP